MVEVSQMRTIIGILSCGVISANVYWRTVRRKAYLFIFSCAAKGAGAPSLFAIEAVTGICFFFRGF